MSSPSFNVTIIGIGSMGFGMATSLLASPCTQSIIGYDRNPTLVSSFYEKTKEANKSVSDNPPTSLTDAVSKETDAVAVVLVNEKQCEEVIFGDKGNALVDQLKQGAYIIICSTVTATWSRSAHSRLESRGIGFIDSPISGGPVRAGQGDLTMMTSDCDALPAVKPLLEAMGREVHVIKGGVGMGSTVKMVHQLLAGVHVCAAAEALALGAKAGLDVQQLYEIVNGAAGASWMFADRGKRMIHPNPDQVNSALDIFVKDLDIIYSEAKALKTPIPLASATLQQFIAAQGLGLGAKDDANLVKVYETVTGVPVAKSKENDEQK